METARNTTIIALSCKGGVGKTSLSALTVRLLAETYPGKRILAIDADPAIGLATALGVEVTATVDDKAIRKTEYTRYHVSPQGFQPGISTGTKRETARISLQAQKQGLTFGHVGNAFREAYLQHPWVERVQIIFITDLDFDYRKLSSLLDQSENITKALDHLLQKVKMDCNTCHLKEICAEVEELCAADAPQIAEAVASRYQ